MSEHDQKFHPPIANVRGIERLRIREPFHEVAEPILAKALQAAFSLKAAAHHGRTGIHAYVLIREETREAEGVLANLWLDQSGRLRGDICGQDSGTIYYELAAVDLGPFPTEEVITKAVVPMATFLTGYKMPYPK